MATIREQFGHPPLFIDARQSAQAAAQALAAHGVGALVVTERGKPVGLVTERELTRQVLARGTCPDAVEVGQVARRGVPAVGPDTSAEACSERMREVGGRYLLVEEDGEVIGVVSMRDVIRALLAEREAEVQDLTAYITGSFG